MNPLDPAAAYRRLAPRVLAYLRGHGAADPEDLLGEVFFQVTRDAGSFRGDGPDDERKWVLRIARNRLFDAGRRQQRRPVEPIDPTELPERPSPPPSIPFDPELIEALQAVTVDQRDVVLLRFVFDLSLAEVAAAVDKDVDAVKQLQRRGLRSLRAALDAASDAPAGDEAESG